MLFLLILVLSLVNVLILRRVESADEGTVMVTATLVAAGERTGRAARTGTGAGRSRQQRAGCSGPAR